MIKKDIKFCASINVLGFVLTFVAGWIDAFALYVFFNENISFMTGRIAKLGKEIFEGDVKDIKSLLFIIVFFIMGACLSACVTGRKGLSVGLYLSGGAVILTAVAMVFLNSKADVIFLVAIPFSMGAQNAATSLTPIGRTTHLTGPITDIGIGIAKGNWRVVLFWCIRFSAFVFGTVASHYVITCIYNKPSLLPLTMFVPGLVIILTGLLQRRAVDIPLLENKA